jgi:hypothetical protein
MSDPKILPPRREDAEPEEAIADQSSQGPSLVLLYSLIALALGAAIFFAMLIVLPFYRQR